ncbi:MAG: arylamine N-acetyltransferase [Opitutus sp.]|nr:arylamine N-acetyltransferase [Opitutus sp.]
MPEPALDLAAYFARLGYNGPRTATPDVLHEIHLRHARAIPYENLDVLLGRGIRIDLASVEQKLVHQKRGGYCFEQNTLLAAALRALGFRVTLHMARVRWQVPAEVATPLTHLVLLVAGDHGRWIADVGFGSMSLFTPLTFEFDREQVVAVEPRRLVQHGSLIVHQARLGEAWGDVYQFTLDEAPAIDCELGNWFTSTHPSSRFHQNLTLARAGDGCRYAVLNREFTIRHIDGRAEKRELATPDELLAVLAQYFDLPFPPGTRFGPPGSPWPS